MSEAILNEHRQLWQEKPVLRAIYTDFYQRITCFCQAGPSLEIGGGSGNLKQFVGEVVTTDIVPTPWLDAAADAQNLPFADASFANIVGVDVLHHLERPRRFFIEAARVLQPGGRIILLEPAITPVSWVFYQFFHPEPVVMEADPLVDGPLDPHRLPFDANQAIPTLLFGREQQRFTDSFPQLKPIQHHYLSLLAYPLSGGFRRWCLVPSSSVNQLLQIEEKLLPWLGKLMAFRLLSVIEKQR